MWWVQLDLHSTLCFSSAQYMYIRAAIGGHIAILGVDRLSTKLCMTGTGKESTFARTNSPVTLGSASALLREEKHVSLLPTWATVKRNAWDDGGRLLGPYPLPVPPNCQEVRGRVTSTWSILGVELWPLRGFLQQRCPKWRLECSQTAYGHGLGW